MRKTLTPHIAVIALLVLQSVLIVSCQKQLGSDTAGEGDATLLIRFNPVVAGSALVFGNTYSNPSAESYSVSSFKFYIHEIELTNSQTNHFYRLEKNEHFLINEADSAASYISLKVSASDFDAISFKIGVDSGRNTSGAQTGALDPAQGMFWTWSTGYIMAKLEGKSPVANTPNNVIEYHIGGFKAGESVIRKVILPFPSGQKLNLQKGSISSLTISADVNRWFGTAGSLRISQKPVSMSPGPLAMQIADNYATMFSVVQIVNE